MHGRVLVEELQVYSSACQPSEDCGLFIIFYFEGGEGLLAKAVAGVRGGARGAGGGGRPARVGERGRAFRAPQPVHGVRSAETAVPAIGSCVHGAILGTLLNSSVCTRVTVSIF